MIWQILSYLLQGLIHGLVLILLDFQSVLVDEVYKKLDGNQQGWKVADETYIQITACGSLDREVPRRNLRRWSLLSWEKVYNLDSDDYALS